MNFNPLIEERQFPDFAVSWAGPGPRAGTFAFGSEDGDVRLTDQMLVGTDRLEKAAPSGEAINGIAFLGQWMAVSTRHEIAVWSLPGKEGPTESTGAHLLCGSHGVVAVSEGDFLAPLGRQGLMLYRAEECLAQKASNVCGTPSAYFYRAIGLRRQDGRDVIACALRQQGIGLLQLEEEGQLQNLQSRTFNGLDVVDICSIATPGRSSAWAALGKDGTIVLFRDARQDEKPLAFGYDVIKGIAYRILSASGYLFVLTSKALYAIADLIDKNGGVKEPGLESPVLTLPMEAVDASVAHEQWVLVTLSDRVLRIDAGQLRFVPSEDDSRDVRAVVARRLSPTWREEAIPQLTLSRKLKPSDLQLAS